MRQGGITKCDKRYYKRTGITKCEKCYYNVRQVLQNATVWQSLTVQALFVCPKALENPEYSLVSRETRGMLVVSRGVRIPSQGTASVVKNQTVTLWCWHGTAPVPMKNFVTKWSFDQARVSDSIRCRFWYLLGVEKSLNHAFSVPPRPHMLAGGCSLPMLCSLGLLCRTRRSSRSE